MGESGSLSDLATHSRVSSMCFHMARSVNLDIGLERDRERERGRERGLYCLLNLLNIDKCFRWAYLIKKTPSATSVSASAVSLFFGFFAALFTRQFNIVYK